MTIAEPLAPPRTNYWKIRNRAKPSQIRAHWHFLSANQNGDGEPAAENLSNLLRRISNASVGEIDNLISELQTLRRKLQTDGDRIERDIAKYAELSQQVMLIGARGSL